MAKANRNTTTPPAAKPAANSFIINPAATPDRYTLIVQGDCMAPLHLDGTAVIADKRTPYAPGDLVVIYIKPELVKPGRCNAMLKRLVSIPHWVTSFPFTDHPESEVIAIAAVETLNPPRRLHYRCSDILAVHRCTGAAPVGMPAKPKTSRVHASDITRRSILRGAATVGAASALAVPALAGHQDAEIFALAAQIRDAAKRSTAAMKPFTRAEEFMIAWKQSNPKPVEPVMRGYEVEDLPNGGISIAFMGVDHQTASREYSDAMAKWMVDLKEWSERASAARLECRLKQLETAWTDVILEIGDLCAEVIDIPATTIEGFKCKASLHEHDEAMADSIVADLLGLAGEMVS